MVAHRRQVSNIGIGYRNIQWLIQGRAQAENIHMSVDLSDLIESLKREVSPPGTDLFPDATDDEYLGHLMDGFWEAVLDGFLANYTENADGIVTPISGSTDLSREFQQLVVFYAGFRIIRSAIRNFASSTRSKAGPVEFEITQSSNLMRDLLAELKDKRNILLRRLSDIGSVPTVYIDAVISRSDAIVNGVGSWMNGTSWSGVTGVPNVW